MKENNKEITGADEMKRCSCCKEYKRRAKFSKNKAKKDGLEYYCKPCKSAKQGIKDIGKYKRTAALREEGKKRCSSCKVVKDFGEYHKSKGAPDGYNYRCKECERTRHQNYYEGNKDILNKKNNEWRKKRYYSDASYRLYSIVKRRIRESIRDSSNYKNRRYFSALGYTPEDLVQHIESQLKEGWNWDNYGEVWVIDHIYPHSKLPYDSLEHPNYKKAWALENLRPLCIKENLRKSDKVLVE